MQRENYFKPCRRELRPTINTFDAKTASVPSTLSILKQLYTPRPSFLNLKS